MKNKTNEYEEIKYRAILEEDVFTESRDYVSKMKKKNGERNVKAILLGVICKPHT